MNRRVVYTLQYNTQQLPILSQHDSRAGLILCSYLNNDNSVRVGYILSPAAMIHLYSKLPSTHLLAKSQKSELADLMSWLFCDCNCWLARQCAESGPLHLDRRRITSHCVPSASANIWTNKIILRLVADILGGTSRDCCKQHNFLLQLQIR